MTEVSDPIEQKENIVKINHLIKKFQTNETEIRALDDLSFELLKGSITALIGLNGAGKTTLLRILSGIYQASAGEVIIKPGIKVGYLAYDTGVYSRLTIREYLLFIGQLRGMGKKEIIEKIEYYAEEMSFTDDLDRLLSSLSTGTIQKVAFSSVILHNPDLLLLDEPFSNVDVLVINVMLNHLRGLKEKGTTILVSTHNLYEIETLCDHYLFLHKGRCIKKSSDEEEVREGSLKEMFLSSIQRTND